MPQWGALPDEKFIGPTHGGVVVDDKRGLIYVSTDSEILVMIYLPDDRFARTIFPECRGFEALAIRQEHGEAAIFGAQRNRNLIPLRSISLFRWFLR